MFASSHDAIMSEKLRIIHSLGEPGLLLPSLINAGLEANDRAKYYFTLLQAAAAQAQHPDRVSSDLRRERLACGVEDESCDSVIASRQTVEADGPCRIPGSAAIMAALLREIETMLQPVVEQGSAELATRFDTLKRAAPAARGDVVALEDISRMTSGQRAGGDALHLLVIDLHKELNVLQAALATETVDGAMTYGLETEDRILVAAFMRGVNRTAPLKFDHPGLGTTATRSGSLVVIQNDIGTTDAHVIVVRIAGLGVTTLYSDVHLQRLTFLESLFGNWKVKWDDILSRKDSAMEDGLYHLCVARYEARDQADLETFLAFLGSRLVFLIDWNKARKRLRGLLGKSEVQEILKWAADEEIGHMGFLKCGGDELVYRALALAAKGEYRPGMQLQDLLSRDHARQLVQFVFRRLARGHAALSDRGRGGGRAVALLPRRRGAPARDGGRACRAGLGGGRRRARHAHAGPAAGLAGAFRRNAARAKAWESQADEIVQSARAALRRSNSGAFVSQLESSRQTRRRTNSRTLHSG